MAEAEDIEEIEQAVELVERVAAIDIAKASGMVCVRLPHEDRPGFRTQRVFNTVATSGATSDGDPATDDAGLVERLGLPVLLIAGDDEAFKVTRPLDLVLNRNVWRAHVGVDPEWKHERDRCAGWGGIPRRVRGNCASARGPLVEIEAEVMAADLLARGSQ